MHDCAVTRPAIVPGHVPAHGGRLHEHPACRGASPTKRLEGLLNTVRAAGILLPHAVLVAHVRLFDADLGPVRAELFGDDQRERGADALAHLRSRHGDRNRAVSIDSDELVGYERARADRPDGPRPRVDAEHQATGGGRADLEKMSPIQLPRLTHDQKATNFHATWPPPAASSDVSNW